MIAALACAAVAFFAAGATCAAASETRASGPPASRSFLLGLRLRGNPAAVARSVSNPSSPEYRRFLTQRQYEGRFAPPVADRQRVLGYLRSQRGVLKVELSADKSMVLAVLTVQAGQRLFCARGARPPSGGLCKPPALRGLVPFVSASETYGGIGSGSASASGSGSGRGGPLRRVNANAAKTCSGAEQTHAYTPAQLSTAYGADPLHARGLQGSGVRVDTLSGEIVDTSSFRTWAQCFGLPTPVVRQFAMPGAVPTGSDETVLDVEALSALAPRLQRITPIFVALDQGFAHSFLLFMYGALDPSRQGGMLPNVLSISDGDCEYTFTRNQLMLGQRMLTEAALLGITALAASGDLGLQGCFRQKPGVQFPGSSPFTTSIGGTELALTATGQISSQIVWSTYGISGGSNGTAGGPSVAWQRPTYQVAPGIGPQLQRGKPTRLTPDLAAMASFTPGFADYNKQDQGWGADGGTSAATPFTAAMVALVLEQERKAGRRPLGSLNPFLYRLARGPQYHSIFYDITKGTSSRRPRSPAAKTPAGGAAQPGYDLATGLGSLNASAFAAAVAALGS
ncbi:MAG TPA: S53 family peptidase [Solirubrobacteraceae bacterium]